MSRLQPSAAASASAAAAAATPIPPASASSSALPHTVPRGLVSASSLSTRLSAGEVAYICGGAASNCRLDGRTRLDLRPFSVRTGVLPQANGSASIHLQDTHVLVTVTLTMVEPEMEEEEQGGASGVGMVKCNVEHSAAAAIELDEREVAATNALLSNELTRLLSSSHALPLSSLVVIPDQQVWCVHVDALIVSNDGNVLDAMMLATKAALVTTTIPPIEVVAGDGGASEIIVNDDPFSCIFLPGVSRTVPLAVSLCKMPAIGATVNVAGQGDTTAAGGGGGGGEWILDPTAMEESCCSTRLTLSIAPDGRLSGMSQSGISTISCAAFRAIMDHLPKLGMELDRKLMRMLRESGVKMEGEERRKKQTATTATTSSAKVETPPASKQKQPTTIAKTTVTTSAQTKSNSNNKKQISNNASNSKKKKKKAQSTAMEE